MFPASRLPKRVIAAALFDRLPVSTFDVAGGRSAGAHLAGKFDDLQHANARLFTVKFLVGLEGQISRCAVPLEVR